MGERAEATTMGAASGFGRRVIVTVFKPRGDAPDAPGVRFLACTASRVASSSRGKGLCVPMAGVRSRSTARSVSDEYDRASGIGTLRLLKVLWDAGREESAS
jgi:hypothetical protein